MITIYYIAVAILAISAVLVFGVGIVAITHIIRNPNEQAVQNLDGPVREYLLEDKAQPRTEHN